MSGRGWSLSGRAALRWPAMDIITYSIPVFFVLILLEALLAWRLGRQVYRLNDSLNDLSCGIINQVVSFFTAAALLVPYAWLYQRGHWLELAEFSAPAWVLGLLGVDLAYYWFHRTVHEHNLLWGAHVVHHQSEEYNLTVALRQAAFEPWVSWIFRLPLALLGVPPLTVAACVAVDTVAQFWVRSQEAQGGLRVVHAVTGAEGVAVGQGVLPRPAVAGSAQEVSL